MGSSAFWEIAGIARANDKIKVRVSVRMLIYFQFE
jgi:hypothetical protein